MQQHYEKYTAEDQEVWQILFDRQWENLQDKACRRYLSCLEAMRPVLHGKAIPRFEDLNACLLEHTGWQIEVVKGLIPPIDFFELLSQKRFCSSTWLRKKEQLDYLEEPDMFHDIFGHIPLLIHEPYANFMQQLGALGVKMAHAPHLIDQLERLYWYTIEFGLVQEKGNTCIYGAGILSSYGESKQVLTTGVQVRPFDLKEMLALPFNKSEMQPLYYEIEDLQPLFASLEYLKNSAFQAA